MRIIRPIIYKIADALDRNLNGKVLGYEIVSITKDTTNIKVIR